MSIYHTALTVENLERSCRFYEQLFGLRRIFDWERSEQEVKGIMLEDDHGSKLELIQPTKPSLATANLVDLNEIGLKHIAFVVKNIEIIFDTAVAEGSKVIWPVQQGTTVKKVAFITDPDGILVELVELHEN